MDLFHILFNDSLTNFIVKYLEMATGDIHFSLFFIIDSFLMLSRLSETHLEGLPLLYVLTAYICTAVSL